MSVDPYQGVERRALDPSSPAVAEPAPGLDVFHVRTGNTRRLVGGRAAAETMAYVHNHMHGHLLAEIAPADARLHELAALPLPLDRRAESPDMIADSLLEVSWMLALEAAADQLDQAATVARTREDTTRADELDALAFRVREVLNA